MNYPDNNKLDILEIKKHSAAIQISNSLTAQQRKSYNYLLYVARNTLKADPAAFTFKVGLADIKKAAGINATDNVHLKKSLEQLMKIYVTYNILNKDRSTWWGSFVLLAGADIKNGVVEFSFPHQIRDRLMKPAIYAILDLNVIRNLTSKYSIALYELAKDYINVSIPTMDINKLRHLMGVPQNAYTKFRELKKYVINVAVKEITEKTDISISYKTVQEGNKVIAIKFFTKHLLEK